MSELEQRIRFVLDGQVHCDHFLQELADPRDQSVLVVGCGAGTEMLWCLRRGAREVLGIDVLEQDPAALRSARAQFEVAADAPAEIRRLDLGDARSLGRKFDLVLSNNVFEHVADVQGGLEACAAVLEPGGRIAIFSAPLYHSSLGSHLEHEPWEHLWGEPRALRERILAAGRAPEALHRLELEDYLEREITLNRFRFIDYVTAARRAGLVVYKLAVLPDRHLAQFARYEARLRERLGEAFTPQDLTIEGLFLVLGAAPPDRAVPPPTPTPAAAPPVAVPRYRELADSVRELEAALAQVGRELESARAQAGRDLEQATARSRALERELAAVARSVSFRLGRALTWPARGVRRLLRRRP